jgi:hypothetical protein
MKRDTKATIILGITLSLRKELLRKTAASNKGGFLAVIRLQGGVIAFKRMWNTGGRGRILGRQDLFRMRRQFTLLILDRLFSRNPLWGWLLKIQRLRLVPWTLLQLWRIRGVGSALVRLGGGTVKKALVQLTQDSNQKDIDVRTIYT